MKKAAVSCFVAIVVFLLVPVPGPLAEHMECACASAGSCLRHKDLFTEPILLLTSPSCVLRTALLPLQSSNNVLVI